MSLELINGLRFQVATAGGGFPLLFLGGTGWDLRRRPPHLFEVLGDGFGLITYDQRGMGLSDKPEGPCIMADYAQDALGVLDHFHCPRALVMGYSFGGMVAQELAIRWPDRVAALVLNATTAGGEGGASFPIEMLLDLPPLERAQRSLEIADLRLNADWRRDHPVQAQERIRRLAERQAEFMDDEARAGQARQLAARAGHDCFDRLHRVQAPTLVLAGQHDGQAPLAHQRKMADAIPGCRFEITHGSHLEISESDAIYRRAAKFFRDVI